MGAVGPGFFLVILFGVLIHLITVTSYRDLLIEFPEPGGDLKGLQAWLGFRAAAVVAVCGKLPLTVFASTGLLVSAGFVFNEVFVYWFPNFTFAYLLLAAALVVNFFGGKAVRFGLVTAVVLAGSGLFVLALAGFLKPVNPETALWESSHFDYRYLTAGIPLFIGFDMALFGQDRSKENPFQGVKPIIVSIAASGMLLVAWGMAGLTHVPSTKLASSTIPHMVAARNILGQPGRILMGVVVISGVFGAVNALLYATRRMIGRLVKISAYIKDSKQIRAAENGTLIFIAGTTGLLMAGGMAGSPLLEVYILAGLILWLFLYAAIHGAALHSLHRTGQQQTPRLLIKGIAVLAILFAAAGLTFLASKPMHLLMFLCAVPSSVFVAVTVFTNYLNRDSQLAPRSIETKLDSSLNHSRR
ncbi:hypothetical protein ACFL0O_08580 [Thermodesulfobacteriota bacterium]